MEKSVSNDFKELYKLYYDKAEYEMNEIRSDIKGCNLCFPENSKIKVFGSGHPMADLFIVKSTFTKREGDSNIAFFGKSGNAIKKSCEKLNYDYSNLYGTDVVKCFVSEEIRERCFKNCSKFLKLEILTCQPKLILSMGELATRTFNLIRMEDDEEIEFYPGNIYTLWLEIKVLVTNDLVKSFYDLEAKRQVWNDIQKFFKMAKKIETPKDH
ncbi:MAG: uracil-DNA glycosylase family protein [Candidatus Humimicrobiia bacterium]